MSLRAEARPMGIGELLDVTVRLYRSRFWRLLGITVLGQIPLAALQLFLMIRGNANMEAAGFVVSAITMTFVSLLTQAFIEPLILLAQFGFADFAHGINLLARSAPLLLL